MEPAISNLGYGISELGWLEPRERVLEMREMASRDADGADLSDVDSPLTTLPPTDDEQQVRGAIRDTGERPWAELTVAAERHHIAHRPDRSGARLLHRHSPPRR